MEEASLPEVMSWVSGEGGVHVGDLKREVDLFAVGNP
jgi:hypothetical protein